MKQTLKLFSASYCPYCKKVLQYLESKNISVPVIDTQHDVEGYQELIRVGGKSQIPCLFIDGVALYESNDIIQWFEDHYE